MGHPDEKVISGSSRAAEPVEPAAVPAPVSPLGWSIGGRLLCAGQPLAGGGLGRRLALQKRVAMASIVIYDLTLGYDGHPAVHHLSGTFEPGSMTAVAGPNGSGKSTLLKGIAGTLRPFTGRIDLGGLKIFRIAYLPQQARIDRSFPITVLDLVALGLWEDIGMFAGMRDELWRKVRQALAAVGLEGFERRPISDLSVGQFQRSFRPPAAPGRSRHPPR